tara:strand:- start:1154 stop:1798 length:645 start_codon:yes stop_codon:yes gene_type:complete
MDEDITIINTNTRNERIKNFFIENKKKIIFLIIFFIIILISIFYYQSQKDKNKKLLSDKYNFALIEFNNDKKLKAITSMKEIIEKKDNTYSPLALYFLVDNKLIQSADELNSLFDILIEETNLESEIKNLVIYKKALYNSDTIGENELLNILKPIINNESVWSSHALYLLAEYFYSKNEIEKSKEFFNKILTLKIANQDIIIESQKRLNRDLSE